jgi:hypothetical protein
MDVARSARLTASVLEGVLALAIVMVVVFGVLRPAIGPAGLGLGSGPVFGRMPTVDTTLDLESVTVTTDPALSTLEGRTVEPGDGVEFAVPTGTEVAVFGPDLRQRLAFVATPRGHLAPRAGSAGHGWPAPRGRCSGGQHHQPPNGDAPCRVGEPLSMMQARSRELHRHQTGRTCSVSEPPACPVTATTGTARNAPSTPNVMAPAVTASTTISGCSFTT